MEFKSADNYFHVVHLMATLILLIFLKVRKWYLKIILSCCSPASKATIRKQNLYIQKRGKRRKIGKKGKPLSNCVCESIITQCKIAELSVGLVVSIYGFLLFGAFKFVNIHELFCFERRHWMLLRVSKI